MFEYLNKLQKRTRWDNIPDTEDGYRLLCSNPVCSLSCANLRNGRLAVTSMHGNDRHSYLFTKHDMVFATLEFLNTLSETELHTFAGMFNKVSPDLVLNTEKI